MAAKDVKYNAWKDCIPRFLYALCTEVKFTDPLCTANVRSLCFGAKIIGASSTILSSSLSLNNSFDSDILNIVTNESMSGGDVVFEPNLLFLMVYPQFFTPSDMLLRISVHQNTHLSKQKVKPTIAATVCIRRALYGPKEFTMHFHTLDADGNLLYNKPSVGHLRIFLRVTHFDKYAQGKLQADFYRKLTTRYFMTDTTRRQTFVVNSARLHSIGNTADEVDSNISQQLAAPLDRDVLDTAELRQAADSESQRHARAISLDGIKTIAGITVSQPPQFLLDEHPHVSLVAAPLKGAHSGVLDNIGAAGSKITASGLGAKHNSDLSALGTPHPTVAPHQQSGPSRLARANELNLIQQRCHISRENNAYINVCSSAKMHDIQGLLHVFDLPSTFSWQPVKSSVVRFDNIFDEPEIPSYLSAKALPADLIHISTSTDSEDAIPNTSNTDNSVRDSLQPYTIAGALQDGASNLQAGMDTNEASPITEARVTQHDTGDLDTPLPINNRSLSPPSHNMPINDTTSPLANVILEKNINMISDTEPESYTTSVETPSSHPNAPGGFQAQPETGPLHHPNQTASIADKERSSFEVKANATTATHKRHSHSNVRGTPLTFHRHLFTDSREDETTDTAHSVASATVTARTAQTKDSIYLSETSDMSDIAEPHNPLNSKTPNDDEITKVVSGTRELPTLPDANETLARQNITTPDSTNDPSVVGIHESDRCSAASKDAQSVSSNVARSTTRKDDDQAINDSTNDTTYTGSSSKQNYFRSKKLMRALRHSMRASAADKKRIQDRFSQQMPTLQDNALHGSDGAVVTSSTVDVDSSLPSITPSVAPGLKSVSGTLGSADSTVPSVPLADKYKLFTSNVKMHTSRMIEQVFSAFVSSLFPGLFADINLDPKNYNYATVESILDLLSVRLEDMAGSIGGKDPASNRGVRNDILELLNDIFDFNGSPFFTGDIVVCLSNLNCSEASIIADSLTANNSTMYLHSMYTDASFSQQSLTKFMRLLGSYVHVFYTWTHGGILSGTSSQQYGSISWRKPSSMYTGGQSSIRPFGATSALEKRDSSAASTLPPHAHQKDATKVQDELDTTDEYNMTDYDTAPFDISMTSPSGEVEDSSSRLPKHMTLNQLLYHVLHTSQLYYKKTTQQQPVSSRRQILHQIAVFFSGKDPESRDISLITDQQGDDPDSKASADQAGGKASQTAVVRAGNATPTIDLNGLLSKHYTFRLSKLNMTLYKKQSIYNFTCIAQNEVRIRFFSHDQEELLLIPEKASCTKYFMKFLYLYSSDDTRKNEVFSAIADYSSSVSLNGSDTLKVDMSAPSCEMRLLNKLFLILGSLCSLTGVAFMSLPPALFYPIPTPASCQLHLFDAVGKPDIKSTLLLVNSNIASCIRHGSITEVLMYNDSLYSHFFGTNLWLAILQSYIFTFIDMICSISSESASQFLAPPVNSVRTLLGSAYVTPSMPAKSRSHAPSLAVLGSLDTQGLSMLITPSVLERQFQQSDRSAIGDISVVAQGAGISLGNPTLISQSVNVSHYELPSHRGSSAGPLDAALLGPLTRASLSLAGQPAHYSAVSAGSVKEPRAKMVEVLTIFQYIINRHIGVYLGVSNPCIIPYTYISVRAEVFRDKIFQLNTADYLINQTLEPLSRERSASERQRSYLTPNIEIATHEKPSHVDVSSINSRRRSFYVQHSEVPDRPDFYAERQKRPSLIFDPNATRQQTENKSAKFLDLYTQFFPKNDGKRLSQANLRKIVRALHGSKQLLLSGLDLVFVNKILYERRSSIETTKCWESLELFRDFRTTGGHEASQMKDIRLHIRLANVRLKDEYGFKRFNLRNILIANSKFDVNFLSSTHFYYKKQDPRLHYRFLTYKFSSDLIVYSTENTVGAEDKWMTHVLVDIPTVKKDSVSDGHPTADSTSSSARGATIHQAPTQVSRAVHQLAPRSKNKSAAKLDKPIESAMLETPLEASVANDSFSSSATRSVHVGDLSTQSVLRVSIDRRNAVLKEPPKNKHSGDPDLAVDEKPSLSDKETKARKTSCHEPQATEPLVEKLHLLLPGSTTKNVKSDAFMAAYYSTYVKKDNKQNIFYKPPYDLWVFSRTPHEPDSAYIDPETYYKEHRNDVVNPPTRDFAQKDISIQSSKNPFIMQVDGTTRLLVDNVTLKKDLNEFILLVTFR